MYFNAHKAREGKGVTLGFSLYLQCRPAAVLVPIGLSVLVNLNDLGSERSRWQGLILCPSSLGLQQIEMDEFLQPIASRCSLRECLRSFTQFNLRHK